MKRFLKAILKFAGYVAYTSVVFVTGSIVGIVLLIAVLSVVRVV